MKILGILLWGALSPNLGHGASPQPLSPEQLRAVSDSARKAMAAGDFAEAVVLYRQLSQALPDLPGPRMNLGIAHYMAGDYRAAIEELEKIAAKDSDLAPALLFLGAGHLQAGNPQSAIKPLKNYLKIQPDDPRARRMMADALLFSEDYYEASKVFRRLAAEEPASPKLWQGLGRCYEALAQDAFQRLEAKAPKSAYSLALLADSRAAQRQYASAFFFYRKALEKKPIRGLHVAVAQIYRQTGHPDWAKAEQRKELERGVPDCHSEMLVCDFLEGKFLEVAEAARLGDGPDDLYWQSKAYDQLALAAFSRLAQLPPSFELHEVIAQSHQNSGRYREAAAEWRKALDLAPENPLAQRELAVSLFLSRDYDDAEPLVQSLLEKEPDSAQLNYLAGAIQLERQQAQRAAPLLEKALKIDPDLDSAHSALGRAYLSLGEAAKAIPHLKRALKTDDDGSIHYQLSRAYQSEGDRQAARRLLQQYQQLREANARETAQLSEEVKITPP